MFKISSICGIAVVLVFSIAKAPTSSTPADFAGQAAFDTESFTVNGDAPSADGHRSHARTFADFGDLERFQIDELNLPQLNVELPALFDWSDGERSYLAFNETEFGAVSSEYDSASNSPTIRIANAGSNAGAAGARDSSSRLGFGGGAVGGRVGGANPFAGISKHTANGEAPAVTATSTVAEPQADATQPIPVAVTAANDARPASPSPTNAATGSPTIPQTTTYPPQYYLPIDTDNTAGSGETVATPVPLPGSLGLFALGLIGLHLAGRKKKGNG